MVWCGYDSPEEIVLTDSSENPAVSLWKQVMRGVYPEGSYAEFQKPSEVVTASYCRDSGLLATDACRKDPRGDRTIQGELYLEDIPTQSCQVHRMVEMCGASNHVANEYCSQVPGNDIYEQSMLNIVRGFPTPGIVVLDQQYVVSERALEAGLFEPVSTEVDPMNMECYIHSEADLPREEEEDEEEGGLGSWLDEWLHRD